MIIYEIKQRLKEDLYNNLKTGNSNSWDDPVDNIQIHYAGIESVTSDKAIVIDAVQVGPEEFEIAGRQGPTLNEYLVSIAIRVTSGDVEYGEQTLAKIMRRIWRTIYTSDLRGPDGSPQQQTITNLSVVADGISERVTHAYIQSAQEDAGELPQGMMAYVGVIVVRVRTQIQEIS